MSSTQFGNDREHGRNGRRGDGGEDSDQPMDALVSRQEDSARESWAGDERALSTTNSEHENTNDDDDDVNKALEDVRATGRWGSVTRTEKLIVLAITVGVIVTIVLVSVLVAGKSKSDDGNPSSPRPPTPAPTTTPTSSTFTAFEQLTALFAEIGNRTSTMDTIEDLPDDDEAYKGLYEDPSQLANVRAMSWILHEDPQTHSPSSKWLITRYALTTLYYSTGGPQWLNSSGWLTGEDTCTWFGIQCDSLGKSLEQIDLQSNNLNGTMPVELGLLDNVRAIWLRRNKLRGKLPAKSFNDIKTLQDLYLETNELSGRIPAILAESVPPLTTLFLQQNKFIGIFPMEFCSGPLESPILERFGLDCDRNGCICCNVADNCFD